MWPLWFRAPKVSLEALPTYSARKRSGAAPDIPVAVRTSIIEVDVEDAGTRAIVPVAAG